MNKQGMIQRTLLAMAIATAFGASTALAGDFHNPQKLEVGAGGFVTVTGTIKNPSTTSPDVHFYSFDGRQGESVMADIDFAHNGTATGLDTSLFLFDPAGTMRMSAFVTDPADSGSIVAPGSTRSRDPLLQFTLDNPGLWKVAVVAAPAMLTHNGGFLPGFSNAFTNGPYTLTVSGLQPAIQQVTIDIKPGNNNPAPLNPKSKGVIPVAVLSSDQFDALKVDVYSLKFGRKGDEASYVGCLKHGKDVNGDGKLDLVCHFDNEKTRFQRDDSAGLLTGTIAGKPFEGRGDLKVIPDQD